jgi:uncharacterized membrane protein
LSKLRLLFILSLVILAGVFLAILYFIPSIRSYPEPYTIQVIDGDEEWILQCDIANNEARDVEYGIIVTVDDRTYQDSTMVKPGKTYTYIHHVYPQQLVEGKVTFELYQDGQKEPIKQATFHIPVE